MLQQLGQTPQTTTELTFSGAKYQENAQKSAIPRKVWEFGGTEQTSNDKRCLVRLACQAADPAHCSSHTGQRAHRKGSRRWSWFPALTLTIWVTIPTRGSVSKISALKTPLKFHQSSLIRNLTLKSPPSI